MITGVFLFRSSVTTAAHPEAYNKARKLVYTKMPVSILFENKYPILKHNLRRMILTTTHLFVIRNGSNAYSSALAPSFTIPPGKNVSTKGIQHNNISIHTKKKNDR
jgi:hypothetical protein